MNINKLNINSLQFKRGAVSITASTVTLNAKDHGNMSVVLNRAAGVTVTLPAATGSGTVYRIIVGTTVTSNNDIIQVANSTDEFHGGVWQCDTDTSDAMTFDSALDGDGYDTITMNGTTTGGTMGDWFEITDYAAGKFHLDGLSNSNGTVADLLSAAV